MSYFGIETTLVYFAGPLSPVQSRSAVVSAFGSQPKGPGFDSRVGRVKIGIYLLMYVASVHLAVSRYGK